MKSQRADMRDPLRPRLRQRLSNADARDYGIVIAFFVLFVVLSVSSRAFLSTTNLLNILDQWSAVGVIACGGTLVLIAGGFDLSVGAIFALAGVVAAKIALSAGVPIGLVAGVLTGLLAGVLNGLITTVVRINALIGTIATSIIFRGLAIVLTGGFLVTVSEAGFQDLGRNELLGAKLSVYIFGGFAVICAVLLHRSVFGRYIYAAGGNPEAARLSGIRVNLVRTVTYGISGLSAGIAGVIVASRVSTGQADSGNGLEYDVFAAIVIGGTSIYGGHGAIWRTVLGVFILAMIGNGFTLLGVDPTYQRMIFGGIILVAVGFDAWIRRASRTVTT